MKFESIARKASEREDYVSAIITLSRGLKRLDDVDHDAFDFMIDLYANACQAPGLERDVAAVVSKHYDASLISGQIIAVLDARDMHAMSRDFLREMHARHIPVEHVSLDSLTEPPPREPRAPFTPSLPPALSPSPEDRSGRFPVAPSSPDETLADDLLAHSDLHAQSVSDAPAESDEGKPQGADVLHTPRAMEWTDEVEREDPEVPSHPLSSPQPPRALSSKPHASHDEASSAPPRRSLLLLVLAVLLVSALLAAIYTPYGAQTRALTQQLEVFDTLNPAAFDLLVGELDGEGIEELEILERREFARMLLALERGDALPGSRVLSTQQTRALGAWGRGARVWSAMQRRDVEAALTHVEAMERTHPDHLATLWTRARLAEERGEFLDAEESYTLALASHPRFLAGLMGNVRMAYMSGHPEAFAMAVAALEASYPEHPYLGVEFDPWLEAPSLDGLGGLSSMRGALDSDGESDRFTRAYNAYVRARTARERGNTDQAKALVSEAISMDPHMMPALLFQGIVFATTHRPDLAGQTFARYVATEQLDVRARLAAMVHAPRALRESGRPDLALVFAFDPGAANSPRRRAIEAADKRVQESEARWRPVWLELSPAQQRQHALATREATLELGWTLLELGRAQDVLHLVRSIEEDASDKEVDHLLWFAHLTMGSMRRLQDERYQHRDTPEEPYPEALAALSAHERERLFSL